MFNIKQFLETRTVSSAPLLKLLRQAGNDIFSFQRQGAHSAN